MCWPGRPSGSMRSLRLAGAATLEIPWQVQIALNIPPYPHRPGIPHIDAGNPEPTTEPVNGTFTLLAGILMTDQLTENSGNLWVWPGTHLSHAAYFRDHGPQLFCAYPPIDLPEPEQVKGRAGDLLLAHYLLGHNIGANYESEQARRALYFRISAKDHASHRDEFLRDPWLDYGPIGGSGVSGKTVLSRTLGSIPGDETRPPVGRSRKPDRPGGGPGRRPEPGRRCLAGAWRPGRHRTGSCAPVIPTGLLTARSARYTRLIWEASATPSPTTCEPAT